MIGHNNERPIRPQILLTGDFESIVDAEAESYERRNQHPDRLNSGSRIGRSTRSTDAQVNLGRSFGVSPFHVIASQRAANCMNNGAT
jgi:hypothetical protein